MQNFKSIIFLGLFCVFGGLTLNAQIEPGISIEETDTTWFSNDKNFSVCLWIKSDSPSSDTTIILSNSDFRVVDAGIYGKRRTNTGITLYSCNGSWGWNIGNEGLHYNYEPLAEDQPIDDGKWHLLAFTYNKASKEIRLFYDGINRAILHIGDLDSRNFRSSLPMKKGGSIIEAPYYPFFTGQVEDLRAWDYSINPEEIKKEYAKRYKYPKEPELGDRELTVVNWNIWHGGTHFTMEKDSFDGIERVTEMLRNCGADVIMMQETYGAGSQISSALGYYYYEASSTIGAVWGANLSVMSRFPIDEAYMVEERSNYGKNYAFNNGGVKVKLSSDKSVIAFSNWYNGSKPEDLEGALKAWQELINQADEVPIVYSGDFNSISHLDDGLGKSGHSKLMEKFGFIDSFRKLYPAVKKYPGKTAPRFEDRIDFIYYKGNKLKLTTFEPIDPRFKGKASKTPGYPSDHMGLIARFSVK